MIYNISGYKSLSIFYKVYSPDAYGPSDFLDGVTCLRPQSLSV